jgi:DNA (cytosine-5)-methyltransferase 1
MGQRLNPFGVLQVVHLVRQDLSIAGKRAGLAGARSGLFMEQVRIVKEMREADKRNGRTGDMVRPRYLVWENVVGAFSSNQGKDFAAVLEEIIKIVEPEAPGIEVPEKGWPTWGGYHDEMGGRWSVVWRTHDAQYWGVPQRRRRISVVADFGGDTASEIQFDGESVSGDIAESGAAGEGFAEAAERGFNPAGGDCMTAWDCQSKRIFDTNGKSPALQGGVGGGVNNPAIFAAIPINDKATRWQGGGESRNHDGSGNGLGIGKEGDPSPTLTAGDRHGVMCMTPWDAQSQRVYDGNGVSPTLSSRENSGLNREAVLCAGFKDGQGAQAGGIGYSEEVSPTLAATPSGTNRTPAVVAYSFDSLASNSMKSKNPHSGCREVDVAKTLDTTDPTPSKNQGGIAVVAPAAMAFDTTQITSKENGSQPGFGKPCHTLNANAHVPCVALDMTHACDVIRECGEQVPALQARMGTGGKQVPLTYGIGNGQVCEASIMAEEVSQTLNTMHDAQAVMCEDVAHALRAKANCAYREDAETYLVQNMVVRRLTPMECERLQGFPDGWTDIGDWVKTDKRGREIKVKGSADSSRYKALGNSIALPFWDWMLRHMARYLPEDATLGSLFDGISGFNVCWARIHGAEHCRWSSEIEQFPIAVTKKHFGDEKSGETGDWEIFSGGMT